MFSADRLLIEKAQVALMATSSGQACAISGPLDGPYESLRLAVFGGDDGKRMAEQARATRRFVHEDRAYSVIADLSRPLGREDALVVEPA